MKNTALNFRLPLSNENLPGARVVRGYEGPFTGVDYRNVKVFSYLKKIPDSPWFMVTKIDKKEIFSALTEQLVLISLIIILLILSIIMMMGFTIRSQRIRVFRELNNSKDKFFSIISHDLKTPFVSIVGFSDLLYEKIRKNDFHDTDKYAAIIQESSYSAMSLLSNLVEWSRIQSGRIKTNIQPVDLCRIIDESVLLLNASATQKSISIVKKIPEKLYILADGVMISTVIRNLVSNSIKFSHENSVIIISVSDGEENILTEIKDFGIGIEKPVLEKLFLTESTVSVPGTRNEVGTALGLIICKEFVSMHNGRIWAESEPGKGSTFTFSIPKKLRE
jgi:signal transduction histidine kinase